MLLGHAPIESVPFAMALGAGQRIALGRLNLAPLSPTPRYRSAPYIYLWLNGAGRPPRTHANYRIVTVYGNLSLSSGYGASGRFPSNSFDTEERHKICL
jgi:hypothetical protein